MNADKKSNKCKKLLIINSPVLHLFHSRTNRLSNCRWCGCSSSFGISE